MEKEGQMTDKKYSTGEMVDALSNYQNKFVSFLADRYVESIVSRLRAADELERKYAELVEVVSVRTDGAKLKAADALCEAADAHVKKLQEVLDSKSFQSVFVLASIHGGGGYDGPTIDPEYRSLRKAIEDYREAR